MALQPTLGIIGGSGLYEVPGLEQLVAHEIDTPFGKPSAPIVTGVLEGQQVAFLARHGIGHHISPTEVPYRANIFAMKSLGVERICSVSACGSLREDFAPGHIVVPAQIFDHTHDRARSFFGEGLVAHVGAADPICSDFADSIEESLRAGEGVVHRAGTLIVIEGPRFSTKAESHVYRSWGMSLIGMTAAPEAFLAREAEICYAVMAHVTDYDVWRTDEETVTVERVVQTLRQNTERVTRAIRYLAAHWSSTRNCNCGQALSGALITDPSVIPTTTRKKLDLLVRKYVE